MNWNALKSFKCPNCNSLLMESGSFYKCSSISKESKAAKFCFIISKTKFNHIINKKYNKQNYQSEDQRLSELNNLGRKEVSEDFSDNQPDL